MIPIIKVLIAEDEERTREELVECLTDEGFECVEAANGEEGLNLLLRDKEITIVLSDILMPGTSGLDMINTAQSEFGKDRDIEFIVLTGHGGSKEAITALKLGVVDFIEKPIDLNNLVHVVHRAKESILLKQANRHYQSGLEDDIQALREIEKNFQRAQKMDAIGQLTGGIAHDFNNILGIVSGNLELLQSMLPSDSKEYEFVKRALKGTTRGASLTRKMLNFASKEKHEVKPTNINDFIVNNIDLIKKSLTPLIKIETNLEKELWITEIDQDDLEDALINLSLNAFDAMPNGGTLTITTSNHVVHNTLRSNRAENKSDFVMMSISDNGNGMSEAVREKVFEPFFTTKDKSKGTGLGLSMVHGFVNRSGGQIQINSKVNEGSTFKLLLPRIKEEVTLTSSQSLDIEYPKGNEIILIVDDEEALREVAQHLLTELGYTILTAASGDEALKILESGIKVDLLFSDIIMPGSLDGYKLTVAVHKIQPDLKILLTSGYTPKLNEILSENYELLSKPYSQLELALAIHRKVHG